MDPDLAGDFRKQFEMGEEPIRRTLPPNELQHPHFPFQKPFYQVIFSVTIFVQPSFADDF